MQDRRAIDQLSLEELRRVIYERKRRQRHERWQRLQAEGRIVHIPGLPAPDESPPPLPAVVVQPVTTTLQDAAGEAEGDVAGAGMLERRSLNFRWVSNKFLLLVEIGAIFGLVAIIWGLWDTSRELNQELALVQQAEGESLALPTPTATPVIDVVVLPSGHKPPIDGRVPEPGEAGDIPEHLKPAINAYQPPPVPTPGPEQARLVQIPAIGVNHPIVQGDDWEQLKKGVGQHIGSGQPGQPGNVVLSAHNDIFGEIFRSLDLLEPGDEIIVSTQRQRYTYVVSRIDVVEPTAVHVMAPTEHASTTLISCYPYNVNTHRIVVSADLVTTDLSS